MSTVAPKKRVYKKKAAAAVVQEVPANTIVALAPAAAAAAAAEDTRPKCNICDEVYNRMANTEVKCNLCQVSSCRKCIQTFLVTTTNDPHCMHCNKAWEREFIDDNLTATYRMNDYKKHRENILLDREIALMPATQYRAEQIKEAEKLHAEMMPPLDAQLKELYEESSAVAKKINAIYILRSDTLHQIRLLRTGQTKKAKVEVNFVRKCPDGECRGFLSTAWKCGLCSKWACPECHEIKGDTRDIAHECKPENVATAKLLAKDSRPCPGCGVVICKIDGCDQMWCSQCHTAFSWRTGQKETGVVHNPHFYEWQRRMNNGVAPRVGGDVACGGVPNYHELRNTIRTMNPTDITNLLNFHRIVQHVQAVEIARFHNVFNEADNEDMRISYLLGNVSADDMKIEIQKREKKREKERAQRRAYEVLVQGGTDLLRRIMAETTVQGKKAITEEIDALRVYINELLAKINERLKLSVPQYTNTWVTVYPFSPSAKKAEALKKEQAAAAAVAAAAAKEAAKQTLETPQAAQTPQTTL